jgi:hypothetical protein
MTRRKPRKRRIGNGAGSGPTCTGSCRVQSGVAGSTTLDLWKPEYRVRRQCRYSDENEPYLEEIDKVIPGMIDDFWDFFLLGDDEEDENAFEKAWLNSFRDGATLFQLLNGTSEDGQLVVIDERPSEGIGRQGGVTLGYATVLSATELYARLARPVSTC